MGCNFEIAFENLRSTDALFCPCGIRVHPAEVSSQTWSPTGDSNPDAVAPLFESGMSASSISRRKLLGLVDALERSRFFVFNSCSGNFVDLNGRIRK